MGTTQKTLSDKTKKSRSYCISEITSALRQLKTSPWLMLNYEAFIIEIMKVNKISKRLAKEYLDEAKVYVNW